MRNLLQTSFQMCICKDFDFYTNRMVVGILWLGGNLHVRWIVWDQHPHHRARNHGNFVYKTRSSIHTETKGTTAISYVMLSNNDTLEFSLKKCHQIYMDGTLISYWSSVKERTLILLYMELLSTVSGISKEFHLRNSLGFSRGSSKNCPMLIYEGKHYKDFRVIIIIGFLQNGFPAHDLNLRRTSINLYIKYKQ